MIGPPVLKPLAELPYLPSPESVIKLGLELADLRAGERMVDLGCGDGRVLVIAARRFGAYAVGIELNPLLVKLAARECALSGVKDCTEVVAGDFFAFDVSRFDVVYCYPSPSITRRLSFKLVSECRRGCRVVVHDHPLEGVDPVAVEELPSQGPHVHRVYLYVAGRSWPA